MPFREREKARSYQRDYRRMERAGQGCTSGCTSPVPVAVRLQTAADVPELLAEQVEAVRADKKAKTLEKARKERDEGRGGRSQEP